MTKSPIIHSFFLAAIASTLISWGVTGHRTIGRIAQNHLSPQARAAVADLLEGASLADASTYADEIRPQPEYRYTAPWHYINLPLDLTADAFADTVNALSTENVNSALKAMIVDLNDEKLSKEKRAFALKFIVHLVGDLHQPMHVSRAEDQGGNKVQLNFNGKGTNLHSVWDSRLLELQNPNDSVLALQYDYLSRRKIKRLQKDPIMDWLFESYQISSMLYAEVDTMNSRSIGNSYYQKHIPTVEMRVQKAGIRLAGVLNDIFDGKQISVKN